MLLLVVLVAVSWAPPAQASQQDTIERMIAARTGTVGQQLPQAGKRHERSGFLMRAAQAEGQPLKTWTQQVGSGMRFIAALEDGQNQALFLDFVPEGMELRVQTDGSIQALDPIGEVAGLIAKPWAVDATGRELATYYKVDGRNVLQFVDTSNAIYPIIADPWVTTGWWYTTPVYYVGSSWSEPWSLKNTLDRDSSNTPALLCAYIPTTTGRVLCGSVYVLVKSDVKATVNAAIANGKCYKARLPASGGLLAMPAYDSYYKTCLR